MADRHCISCGQSKPEESSFRNPTAKDGLGNVCTACVRERVRLARHANGNAACKKYEKTPRGFLMRCYRNMRSRVEGVQSKKAHLYLGKALLEKSEFYAWALNHPDFIRLFEAYRESGWNRRISPSVDRIDSSNGYELGNMQWVTHSVNSSRGSLSQWKAKRAA